MIRRYLASDASSLWPAYEQVFGSAAAESLQRRWQWQYICNPFNPGEPEIHVLVHGDEVVGMHAAFAVPMLINGVPHQGFFLGDLFTLPEFRLGSISLVREMQKLPGIGMGLPNKFSKRLWESLGCFQYFGARKLTALLSHSPFGNKPKIQKFIKPLAFTNRRWITSSIRRGGRALSCDIESSVMGFESKIDEFWRSCETDLRISLRKNFEYLKWRYIDIPNRQYQFRLGVHKGGIVALVVFEIQESGGLLLETLCLRGHEKCLKGLIQTCLAEMLEAGVDKCSVLTNTQSHGSFGAKFWASLGFWVVGRLRTVVGYHKLPEGSAQALSNGSNWACSFGDGERDLVSN